MGRRPHVSPLATLISMLLAAAILTSQPPLLRASARLSQSEAAARPRAPALRAAPRTPGLGESLKCKVRR